MCEHLVEEIAQDLKNKNQTLALAESCTGGCLSSLIVSVPGASDFFKGALVPYTNDMKTKFLHISEEVLETEGFLSLDLAKNMAQKVAKTFQSHWAVSTTGYINPIIGQEEVSKGNICVGFYSPYFEKVKKIEFSNLSRGEIIKKASFKILEYLRDYLKESQ